MAEIYLVRHAQASFGSDDYDQLSDLGFRQSHWLGEYFLEQELNFDTLVTGTMLRHRQTLDGALAVAACPKDAVQVLPGLDEYDFQALIGVFLQKFPDHALVRRCEDSPGDKSAYYRLLRVVLTAWSQDELGNELPESWGGFQARVVESIKWLQDDCSRGKRYLAISSGGAISAFIGQVLGLTPEKVFDLNLQMHNTGISHCFFNADKVSLTGFNAVPHLQTGGRHEFISYG